ELWSTGFTHPGGTVLFDPIAWPQESPRPKSPVEIVQTNANHDRNGAVLGSNLGGSFTKHPKEFSAVPLPGAGEDETAYFHALTGTLVVGDALINLAPHDLMLLPDKYCTDPVLLGKSLRNLALLPVRRIFFAHGAPILQDGLSRILPLLP
ncbi:MAG: hypothetical protein EBZ83_01560, partial [Verrucomicrobia bacterium]|nr:hypothetical protein [Verrucomicrobiota bacterium]